MSMKAPYRTAFGAGRDHYSFTHKNVDFVILNNSGSAEPASTGSLHGTRAPPGGDAWGKSRAAEDSLLSHSAHVRARRCCAENQLRFPVLQNDGTRDP